MGNTTSSQRAQPDDGQVEELRHGRINGVIRDGEASSEDRDLRAGRRAPGSLRAAGQRASILYDTFRRHRQTDRTNLRTSAGNTSPPPEEIEYEQENRPLVDPSDIDMPDAVSSQSVLQTSSRRRIAMSRLGSRLLPDSVARGLLNSGEETEEEGHALRYGSSDRSRPSVYERSPHSESNNRLSLAGSISRRPNVRTESRRRPIRGPFPLPHNNRQPLEPTRSSADLFDAARDVSIPGTASFRHRNRFSRVRDSISISARLSGLLGQSTDLPEAGHSGRSSPARPARAVTFADERDHLLPSLQSGDQRMETDETPHELDAVEPEARTLLASPRVTSGMSTIRRFQPGLRSRSTRLIRRGEHPPLSQVLQLAAAAIAAQLSGHATGGNPGGRHLGSDTFDGSIQNFVQTLQDAATAQAGEGVDINSSDGDLPPVNFMRVFQFPNDENGSPIASQAQSRDLDQMDLDSITSPAETDRSVTLVLVGVRSLPHGQEGGSGENGTLGPSLDTLLSLPFLPPANVLRNGSSGALFGRSDARSRSAPRRHSMTNFSFPAQYETQRHQRTRSNMGRLSGTAETTLSTMPDAAGNVSQLSESPPGPNPPPSTPADIRSGHATPIRRPSSASAAQNSTLPELDEDQATASQETVASSSSFNTARQRRRSDSEFARRPELGSGAARRNGMVEPDHPPVGAGRSWLIYVVGTNVSPDHPAFTMPSLFTDNPSYEDMQMLSTLLGPVKPPVATQADVSSAGGLFRLLEHECGLLGEAMAEVEGISVMVNHGERCLICLSDYEAFDEVRQLNKCQHLYHRECIDEWLTTGRNSCPLCRGQGVQEQAMSSNPAPGAAPGAPVVL
ncbi:uncharacterized protein PV06_01162 [Exophiala oligosperma]|uniref:RING-type domain-containing protein n=1 Tax=Exophiala oligosperma TaxID=215243 RepID=A0A0D2E1E9_9EURO|nr:uncharacterized protein PV06_01162 [Exophiala oligosperma]KIW48590.1 hypothetical protein PV06_01162 [Exophiala oligosperma]